MIRCQYLSKRLEEVLLNGQWIANTNFKSQIQSIDWKQAVKRPSNFNSIAMLTFHVNYYLAGILQVFKGGDLEIRDQYSFDMPAISSEKDRQNLISEFILNAQLFVEEVAKLEDAILEQPFVNPKYGNYLRNLDGVIEHAYYHLGQVSLINKLIKD